MIKQEDRECECGGYVYLGETDYDQATEEVIHIGRCHDCPKTFRIRHAELTDAEDDAYWRSISIDYDDYDA